MKVKFLPVITVLVCIMLAGCINIREKGGDSGNGEAALTLDFNNVVPEGYKAGSYGWNGTGLEYSSVSDEVTFSYNASLSRSVSVFDLLMEFSQLAGFKVSYETYSNGRFVTSIAGVENQGGDTMNWQYWINGKYGELACDRKIVEAGDEVEWRYESNPFR